MVQDDVQIFERLKEIVTFDKRAKLNHMLPARNIL